MKIKVKYTFEGEIEVNAPTVGDAIRIIQNGFCGVSLDVPHIRTDERVVDWYFDTKPSNTEYSGVEKSYLGQYPYDTVVTKMMVDGNIYIENMDGMDVNQNICDFPDIIEGMDAILP